MCAFTCKVNDQAGMLLVKFLLYKPSQCGLDKFYCSLLGWYHVLAILYGSFAEFRNVVVGTRPTLPWLPSRCEGRCCMYTCACVWNMLKLREKAENDNVFLCNDCKSILNSLSIFYFVFKLNCNSKQLFKYVKVVTLLMQDLSGEVKTHASSMCITNKSMNEQILLYGCTNKI